MPDQLMIRHDLSGKVGIFPNFHFCREKAEVIRKEMLFWGLELV